MATAIKLEVVTPLRPVAEVTVTQVVAPGYMGEFTVLPGHATYVARLSPGRLSYTAEDGSHDYVIGAGFADVRGDRMVVLTSSAATREELSADGVRSSLEAARKQLAGLGSDDVGFQDAFERVQLLEASQRLLG